MDPPSTLFNYTESFMISETILNVNLVMKQFLIIKNDKPAICLGS
jgi:hypothetical protein